MTNYKVKNVDEYIQAVPKESRPHLKEIRAAVVSAVPEAEEKIGYGKPYYKLNGWIVGFDVFKNHIGFEVWDGLADDDKKHLEGLGYKTGSVSFQIRYDQKVPAAVIKKLVKKQVNLNERKVKKGSKDND